MCCPLSACPSCVCPSQVSALEMVASGLQPVLPAAPPCEAVPLADVRPIPLPPPHLTLPLGPGRLLQGAGWVGGPSRTAVKRHVVWTVCPSWTSCAQATRPCHPAAAARARVLGKWLVDSGAEQTAVDSCGCCEQATPEVTPCPVMTGLTRLHLTLRTPWRRGAITVLTRVIACLPGTGVCVRAHPHPCHPPHPNCCHSVRDPACAPPHSHKYRFPPCAVAVLTCAEPRWWMPTSPQRHSGLPFPGTAALW